MDDLVVYPFILLILFAECGFLYLNLWPSALLKLANYHTKYFSVILIVAGLFFTMVWKLTSRKKSSVFYPLGLSVVSLMVLGLITAFFSMTHYGFGIKSAIALSYTVVFVPLLYFVLHAIAEKDEVYDFFIISLIGIATLFAIVCLLQSFGLKLVNLDILTSSVRNGRMRLIMSGDFIAMGATLAIGRVLGRRKSGKRFACLCLAICLFELYWVAQTRFLFIGLFAALAFGLIVRGKNRYLRAFVFLILVLMALSQFSDQISAVVFPTADNTLAYSSNARLGAYVYYSSHAHDMGLLGLGYIPTDSIYGSLLETQWGQDALTARGDITDIGVVGYYARYGICGVLVLIVVMIQIVKLCFSHSKTSFNFDTYLEAWVLLAFVVMICPTMTITDPQRTLFIPVLLLLLERALTGRGNNGVMATQAEL